MNLPKTSLNVVYIEPQIELDFDEKNKRLTKFVSLFAQIGFKEYALNKDFASEIDKEFAKQNFYV